MLNLPKIFDKAKNPNYACGYEKRFKRKKCEKCKHHIMIEKHEGCNAKSYIIPITGATSKKL